MKNKIQEQVEKDLQVWYHKKNGEVTTKECFSEAISRTIKLMEEEMKFKDVRHLADTQTKDEKGEIWFRYWNWYWVVIVGLIAMFLFSFFGVLYLILK